MKGAWHGVHTYNPKLREARQGNCLEFETILAYVARPVWKREERKKEKGSKERKEEVGGGIGSSGKGVATDTW